MMKIDSVDQSKTYMDEMGDEFLDIIEKWHVRFGEIIDDFDYVLPNGVIVQCGAYKGYNNSIIQRKWTGRDSMLFDIYPYQPETIVYDVRNLCSGKYDVEIALGYNSAGRWESSPTSKQASLDYLVRNLVKGGLLIEHRECPEFIYDNPSLELIKVDEPLVFFKKV